MVWTDRYDRCQHREGPGYPVDGRSEGGGETAVMAWVDEEPLLERPLYPVSSFSTRDRDVDVDDGRHHKAAMPVPPGNTYPPDETSVQYHGGIGSGAGGGVGARGSAAGRVETRPIQLQHHKAEQQQQRAWRNLPAKEDRDDSRAAAGDRKMTTPWKGTPAHDDAAETAMSGGSEPEASWGAARRIVATSDAEEDRRGLQTERSPRGQQQRRAPAKSAAAVTNDQRASTAEPSDSGGRIAYQHAIDHRVRAVVGRAASSLEGATPEEDGRSSSHDFDPRVPARVRNRGRKDSLAEYFAGHSSSGRAERGTGGREGKDGAGEGAEETASFENQVMDMLASMVGDHGAEARSTDLGTV